MSKQLQLRRGTTIQNEAFTGAVGELTLDTDTGEIRVHNGVTQGGAEFIDAVVAFQKPTAENNYTWYRKYASGWVEQGGVWPHPNPGTYYNNVTITLPVVMADANYSVILSNTGTNTTAYAKTVSGKTTTEFVCTSSGDVSRYNGFDWEVKGMAA